MDASDVELESENSQTSSPRPARKNITLKLKTEKPGRGRPRKSKSVKHEELDPASTTDDEVLDTPIFKTMEPGEPIHHNKKLKWDLKVNLLGEKVVDPLIHCCSLCSLPILIYGRMIQCKHVFCFTCAKKTEKTCPRCGDPVQRIEQSALGTVFLCTYGGSKHGSGGCRRTYLSQRDLNAHIGHRHLKSEIKEQVPAQKAPVAAPSQGKSGLPLPGSVASATSHVSPTTQSHQALLDHFMRQVSAAKLPARPAQEPALYHSLPGQQAGAMTHSQHSLAVTSAHQLSHPQQLSYVPSSAMPSMSGLPGSQPIISHSQALATSSASQDNYTSAIPVVGSRIQTLISVPLQDDDYSNKHATPKTYQPHAAQSGLPNMNYPPPFPVGSLAPNIHQPPPSVGLTMYSSALATASYTNPPPQIMSTGPPRVPPRLGAPPPGAPPRFFEAQTGRGTWTGPPRGPTGPPPRGPPRADYNYY